jgi:hypothetical protein
MMLPGTWAAIADCLLVDVRWWATVSYEIPFPSIKSFSLVAIVILASLAGVRDAWGSEGNNSPYVAPMLKIGQLPTASSTTGY